MRRFRSATLAAAVPALAMALAVAASPSPAAAGREDSASILLYHRFGEDAGASALRLEQFEAHLAELARGGHSVLPLSEVVAALKGRRPLPDRSLAITIDEAHASLYRDAWPRLRRAGLPFTVFVATHAVDHRLPGTMTWEQLRELVRGGAEIGSLSASHPHMTGQTAARNAEEIAASAGRIEAELGVRPRFFAYPYGEWSMPVRAQVAAAGFEAAFGQQSGVAHAGLDWYALPRFAMTQAHGSLGRFRLIAGALPLKVRDVVPRDPVLTRNPPAFGFTAELEPAAFERLACFASNMSGPAKLERLGEGRVEVRLDSPFPPGRARINCTAPAEDDRWRWFGVQFQIPRTPIPTKE